MEGGGEKHLCEREHLLPVSVHTKLGIESTLARAEKAYFKVCNQESIFF